MEYKDYYKILGVPKTANDKDIKAAYRRLARKCEPDLLYRVAKADCLGRSPGNFEPVAMEWFREKVQQLDVGDPAVSWTRQCRCSQPAGSRRSATACASPTRWP